MEQEDLLRGLITTVHQRSHMSVSQKHMDTLNPLGDGEDGARSTVICLREELGTADNTHQDGTDSSIQMFWITLSSRSAGPEKSKPISHVQKFTLKGAAHRFYRLKLLYSQWGAILGPVETAGKLALVMSCGFKMMPSDNYVISIIQSWVRRLNNRESELQKGAEWLEISGR